MLSSKKEGAIVNDGRRKVRFPKMLEIKICFFARHESNGLEKRRKKSTSRYIVMRILNDCDHG
jgi:hypothetical protein